MNTYKLLVFLSLIILGLSLRTTNRLRLDQPAEVNPPETNVTANETAPATNMTANETAPVSNMTTNETNPMTNATTNMTSNSLTVRNGPFGAFIADGNGISLYLFEADSKGNATCVTDCLNYWPAFGAKINDEVMAGPGVNQAMISSIMRPDGTKQFTYNNWPLYYYISDILPDNTNGEGLFRHDAYWYLVTPEGMALKDNSTGNNTMPMDNSTLTVNNTTLPAENNTMSANNTLPEANATAPANETAPVANETTPSS